MTETITQSQQVPGDSSKGPVKLTLQDFFGSGELIDESIIIDRAKKLEVEPEVLMAFTQVESPRGPFMPDGRPWILYEAHVFSRNTDHKYDESHPTLSSRKWNRSLYGAAGDWQYQRLLKAMKLDQSAALMACSWGAWQVLGENYKQLGFNTVEDFVLFNVESQLNQFDCFISEITTTRGLLAAVRAKDWATIAHKYNGPGYRRNAYDVKMAKTYRQLCSLILRKGSQGPKVVSLQKLLSKHKGCKVNIDGVFGQQTEDALKRLQAKWGLTVDGVAGPQVYEALATKRIEETPIVGSKRIIGSVAGAGAGVGAISAGAEMISSVGDSVSKVSLDDLETLRQKVDATNQVVVSTKTAIENLSTFNDQAVTMLILMGIAILGLSGYIAWTKWHDLNKARES